MVSLEKWLFLTPLQKLPKNVEDLGKLIVAKGFKKLPKVQKIANSGHTVCSGQLRKINKVSYYDVAMSWTNQQQTASGLNEP